VEKEKITLFFRGKATLQANFFGTCLIVEKTLFFEWLPYFNRPPYSKVTPLLLTRFYWWLACNLTGKVEC
jgi:hypothetical protein